MACPCCAEDITVTQGSNVNAEAHSVEINLSVDQADNTPFGTGPYGRVAACKRSGTIAINSWCAHDTAGDLGDTEIPITVEICDTTVTASDTTLVNIVISLDATSATPHDYTYTYRINDDVTIA